MKSADSFEEMRMLKESCVQKKINDMYTEFYLDSPDGSGTMSKIDVFPGVQLIICSFKGNGFSSKEDVSNLIEINFCISGIYQCEHTKRERIELNPYELSISKFDKKNTGSFKSCFPFGIYEGVEILLNPDIAEEWIKHNMPVFEINFKAISEKLLNGHWYQVYKPNLHCKHVFSELYAQRKEYRLPLLKLKLVEIFLELQYMDAEKSEYLPSEKILKIRQIRDRIVTDTNSYKNLQQLASENKMSVTQLRKMFQAEYHMPVYSYIKRYRLEQAATALINSNLSVTEIAMNAGYQNPAKFSEMFKKQYGLSPLKYRNKEQNG